MMELNADFLSRLINQIRQQGAVAITLGSGTRLIATWKQDAAAIPTIEVKVVPPQPRVVDADNRSRTRILCPQCRGDREVNDSLMQNPSDRMTCPNCMGDGWIYQEPYPPL